ncbi:MAG: hypothetical protein H6624_06205 [Bdellovibrionaceae bacterium]|nr:hypothetical protein [Bdellovibrionales bacterium]MCB9083916.1 hypothetical protein [Pseudobdellovibrionaceae bacterium]
MSDTKAWAQPFQVSSETYADWGQQAPSDRDFTYWCLETGRLSEGQYLNWAREHYGLASLEPEFFQTSPDLVLWSRVAAEGNWYEWMLPVGEWEGVVFVACVEPPRQVDWDFPVRFVLAPASGLRVAWQLLQQHSQPAIKLGDAGAVTTAKLIVDQDTPAPPKKPTPGAASDGDASIPTARLVIDKDEEKTQEDLFPELPPEKEATPPSLEGLDPSVLTKLGIKPEEEDSGKLNLKASANGGSPEILKGMPGVGEDDKADAEEPHGFTLSHSLNQYLVNSQTGSDSSVVKLDTTAGTSIPEVTPPPPAEAVSEETAEGVVLSVDDEIEDVIDAEVGAQVVAVTSDAPPATEATPEEQPMFAQDEIPTAIIEAAKLKEEEAKRALAEAQDATADGIEEEVTKDAPLPPPEAMAQAQSTPGVTAVECNLPAPPMSLAAAKSEDQVASYVFQQLRDKFEKSMILLFEGTKIRPWKWDSPWVATLPSAADAFDISKACVFRVVRRTRLPYHGYLVKNEINENFFRLWGHSELPDHVTICPIQYDSHLVGMLLSVGDKKCDTPQHLSHSERITIQLSEAMQKVNSSAA